MDDRLGFNKLGEFNVVLACAFEPEENAEQKFEFYDLIGETIRERGKNAFLPHREINLKWHPQMIYEKITAFAIPNSDLVIGYLGLESTATGIMLSHATECRKPVITLLEDELEMPLLRLPTLRETIKFSSNQDLTKKLKESLDNFYQKN